MYLLALVLLLQFLINGASADNIPIPVGITPIGVGYNNENGNIYVTNAKSSTLSIIDSTRNSVLATVLVGIYPYAVTYDQINDRIYVANAGSRDISVISGNSREVIKTINLKDQPTSIIYDPGNNYIYVATPKSGKITIINSTYAIVKTISVEKQPSDMTYDPINGAIYVADSGSNDVSVISGGTTNNLTNNIIVEKNPTAVAYNSANNRIYVVNKNSSSLSLIDATTNSVINKTTVSPLPLGLAINPLTNTVYVTHTNGNHNLTIISESESDKRPEDLKLKSRPERVSVSLKTNTVYLTNPDNDSVTVIDGNTRQIMSTPSPDVGKLTALIDELAFIVLPVAVLAVSFSKIGRRSISKMLTDIHEYLRRTRNYVIEHISNTWISSGITLTIVSLIILPIIVVVYEIHYEDMKLFFLLQYSQYNGLEWQKTALFVLNTIIQGVFIAMLLFFPPFPAPYSSKEYFVKRGFKTAVVEYECVKKILYVAVPLFVLVTIVIPFTQHQLQPLIKNYTSINILIGLQHPAFKFVQGVLFFVVIAGILKIIFAVARKKFRLYYTKGCFEIVADTKTRSKRDEVQRMGYVIRGLNSYNRYLRRHLNLHINNLIGIFSKITRMPTQRKKQVIDDLTEIFKNQSLENATLEPVRYLYEISSWVEEEGKVPVPGEEKTKEKDQEKQVKEAMAEKTFMSAEPLFNKIKEIAAFAAVIIPLAIAIIEVYIKTFLR